MEFDNIDIPPLPETCTPDIEWWDVEYLPQNLRVLVDKFGFIKANVPKEHSVVTVSYADMKLKYCGTAHVIEHPVRLNLIVKHDDTLVAVPLMLTGQGIAVADPSAIERQVREQIAQREKNHEMRNLARKLTPEERREKKLRKIKKMPLAIFMWRSLRCRIFRTRSIVLRSMSTRNSIISRVGVLLCKDSNINMVVVEGGKKAIKQYSKLMMRRIDWNGDRVADEESDSEDEDSSKHGNGCLLVWQGVVARKAFNNFSFSGVSDARHSAEGDGGQKRRTLLGSRGKVCRHFSNYALRGEEFVR
ncbi:unnamed protein product [Peronospora belbahrii]|uniref:Uncharacterized protein n=1 Tax=Peronospora belbahrii TaxID=622444 RepID=A0AAU9KU62_9STRA|nr:unnamed protein product [Peronospora belbahrii]